jgi:hypothetical protein
LSPQRAKLKKTHDYRFYFSVFLELAGEQNQSKKHPGFCTVVSERTRTFLWNPKAMGFHGVWAIKILCNNPYQWVHGLLLKFSFEKLRYNPSGLRKERENGGLY